MFNWCWVVSCTTNIILLKKKKCAIFIVAKLKTRVYEIIMCIEFIDNGVVDGHDLWFYILIMSISYLSQTFHNILHYDEKIMILSFTRNMNHPSVSYWRGWANTQHVKNVKFSWVQNTYHIFVYYKPTRLWPSINPQGFVQSYHDFLKSMIHKCCLLV